MPTHTEESQAFDFIIDLIYERCRIRLHDGKQELIKARLGKRMRHHGFQSLADYCDFLRTRADEDEITMVVDALTTNFTNFLREEDHFQFLVKEALPKILPSGTKRFRVWSAACSSGEEPYSMCFYLAEHYPLSSGWDWSIVATDVSTKALGKAQQAVYAADRVASLPKEWLHRYLQRGMKQWEGHYRVKTQLTDRVSFRHINLLGDYSFSETFEVIFCRNVMIYFDRATQESLVNQLCRFLIPEGYLLIGHSESLMGIASKLRCIRPSIYQKL